MTVSNQSDLEFYANKSGSYIIQISGRINISPMGKDIRVGANKTIIGLGVDAEINGGVLAVESTSNVIIKNLIIADTVTDDWDGKDNDYDGIRIRRSHHVWVHHCTIRRHGDGAIDIVNGSRYVTVSYCVFEAHNKTMLIGGSDGETFSVENPHSVTLYRNWFKGTTQRHPRVRFGKVHVFNNYYSDMGQYGRQMGFTTWTGYAIGFGVDAKIVSQLNYFENVDRPTDRFDNSSRPAYIIDVGSVFVNSGSFTEQTTGTSWVPVDKYHFETIPAADVKSYVMLNAGAGRMNQDLGDGIYRGSGDLIDQLMLFEFSNAENWSVQNNFTFGKTVYGDRDFTILSVPEELEGKEWVSTAMNSRTNNTLDKYAAISLLSDGVVYVVHPNRVTEKPEWLSGYENTGLEVAVKESATVTRILTVFKKNVSAGVEVDLGINSNDGTTSTLMYFVIVDGEVSSSLTSPLESINCLHILQTGSGVKVEINVHTPGDFIVEIFDSKGRVVDLLHAGWKNSGSYSYDIIRGKYQRGLYVVRMRSSTLIQHAKFVL